jgi:hypothetical protein
LVGSTSFKQGGHLPVRLPEQTADFKKLGAQWFDPVAKFFSAIERGFTEEWSAYIGEIRSKCKWPRPPGNPEIWKTNGDEVIYVLEIGDPRDSYAAVVSWMRVARAYRKELLKSNVPLDVKVAAWTAGFPLGNVEVVFRHSVGKNNSRVDAKESEYNEEQARLVHYYRLNKWYASVGKSGAGLPGYVKDYIGPSMDLGFRVASRATPRKFAVTIDLALLLSHVRPPGEKWAGALQRKFFEPVLLRYDGRSPLKGVLGGKPYPFFWIDMLHDDKLLLTEDKLLPPQDLEKDQIRAFCDEFLTENERYIIRPFLRQCSNPELGTIPDDYLKHLQLLDRRWKEEEGLLERESSPTKVDVSASLTPEQDALLSTFKDAILSAEFRAEGVGGPLVQASGTTDNAAAANSEAAQTPGEALLS